MKKQAVFLFCSPILNLLKSANKHTVKETFLRHEKYVPHINQKIHPIKVIVKSLHWGCSCPLYWLKKYNRLIIDWYKGNWSTIQNSSKSWGKYFFLQESIAVNETASSEFAFLPLLNKKIFTASRLLLSSIYWLKKYNRLIIDWYKGNCSRVQNSSKL